MTVLRAREAFACSDAQGTPRVVRPGDLFDSTDPLVTGRQNLFEPVEVATQRSEAVVAGGSSVESATAAPGEKRSVSTGRGRKSSKDSADAAPTEQKSAEATTKSTTTGGVGSTPGASDSK